MSVVENFPKKTLFFVCLARAILALISTILNLHAILSDISPPLTHGSVAVAVLQVAVAVVGMLWAARTASKASLWTLLLLSLLPVIGFIFPVAYMTPFYFYVQWGGSSSYQFGGSYDRWSSAWQYLQCALDTCLGLTSLSLCWAGVRSGGTLAKRRAGDTVAIGGSAGAGGRIDKKTRAILTAAILHAALALLTFAVHGLGRVINEQSLKFTSYLGLVLCTGYFFLFASVSCFVAYFKREKYSTYTALVSNITAVLASLFFFLIFGFFTYNLSSLEAGSISVHLLGETTEHASDPIPDFWWIYPSVLFIVGSSEVVVSSVGIRAAKKMLESFSVISTSAPNHEQQLMEAL